MHFYSSFMALSHKSFQTHRFSKVFPSFILNVVKSPRAAYMHSVCQSRWNANDALCRGQLVTSRLLSGFNNKGKRVDLFQDTAGSKSENDEIDEDGYQTRRSKSIATKEYFRKYNYRIDELEDEYQEKEKWVEIENDFIALVLSNRHKTPAHEPLARKHVEMNLMQKLLKQRKLTLGISYMDYIKSIREPLIFTLIDFAHLCAREGGRSKQQLVYDLYEEIRNRNKSELFDLLSLRGLISAFSYTDQWRTKCFEFLEKCKRFYPDELTTIVCLFPILNASVREGDRDVTYSLLSKLKSEKLYQIYQNQINVFLYESNLIENFFCSCEDGHFTEEEILQILRELRLILPMSVYGSLIDYFRSRKYHVELVRAKAKTGCCAGCLEMLEKNGISSSERLTLQNVVRDKLLIGPDVYRNTTPEELQKFQNFLKQSGEFTVVLDLMNLLGYNMKTTTDRALIDSIMHVLDQLERRFPGGRYLCVTRHLNRRQQMLSALRVQGLKIFAADRMTKDDLLSLYAALCGEKTYLVSRDYFRDHKAGAQEYGHLFARWQHSRQISFRHKFGFSTGFELRHCILQFPKVFEPVTQMTPSAFHIPVYIEDPGKRNPDYYEMPDTFLCVQKSGLRKRKSNKPDERLSLY